jgi:hypothetical protein
MFTIDTAIFVSYKTAFLASGAKEEPTDAELGLGMILRDLETTNTQHAQSVRNGSL